jgi:hypothetical protein
MLGGGCENADGTDVSGRAFSFWSAGPALPHRLQLQETFHA